MIIDSFIFNDEIEMVEFRLQYLWSRVDLFVIVEANKTFTGNIKPYKFDTNRFQWAKEKIFYCPMELDTHPDPWKMEAKQREHIASCVSAHSPDDILMLSDCDEIPTHYAIDIALKHKEHFPVTCDQSIVFYNLTNVNKNPWAGTVITTVGHARAGTQALRESRERNRVIRNGGFHLSYFGGVEQIKSKIESFSHTECNKPEFTSKEHIQKTLTSSGSLFGESQENCYKVGKDFYPADFLKLAPESWWP